MFSLVKVKDNNKLLKVKNGQSIQISLLTRVDNKQTPTRQIQNQQYRKYGNQKSITSKYSNLNPSTKGQKNENYTLGPNPKAVPLGRNVSGKRVYGNY